VGGNFRLDTIQAAVLIVKLRHLEAWHSARRANAARYDELFGDVGEIVTPTVRRGRSSVFNQYVIRVPRAAACREFLKEKGIGCEVYYPLSLHEQECFASLGYKKGDFPESEKAATQTIALPIYPELTEQQIEYVATTVKGFVGGAG
jgi:dTDP-4-amino-4,6-dideoxygalactose transaminase